jgi:hypothetical protein
MGSLVSTTARVTDDRHLELREPLEKIPVSEVRVLIYLPSKALPGGKERSADFLRWAQRRRPSVGLREAGRDTIYED